MPSLGDFIHTQFLLKIPKPSGSFASKTVIITGANGGLGQEIAKHIIRLGASKVIFACRSRSRGEQAKKEIESLMKCKPDIIQVWELDLESPPSVKNFVNQANALPRLDVLINNAGYRSPNFGIAYDTERTIAINTIGTFLLSLQLIPKLKDTARKYNTTPHMTMVGSALYDIAKYPEGPGVDVFEWSKDESHGDMLSRYDLSKLLQLYAAIKLSAIVDPAGTKDPNPIVINSMDPCFCKTGLPGGLTGKKKILFVVFRALTARTAEEGSRLVVQSAAAGRETHGLYMRAGAVQEYAPIAKDDKKATLVWELLCKRLEQLQPGILQNIQ